MPMTIIISIRIIITLYLHTCILIVIINVLRHDPLALIIISRNGKQQYWQHSFMIRLKTSMLMMEMDKQEMSRVIFIDQMKHEYYAFLLCSLDIRYNAIWCRYTCMYDFVCMHVCIYMVVFMQFFQS